MVDAVLAITAVLAVALAIPGALLAWHDLRERLRRRSRPRPDDVAPPPAISGGVAAWRNRLGTGHLRRWAGIGMLVVAAVMLLVVSLMLRQSPGQDEAGGNTGNGGTPPPSVTPTNVASPTQGGGQSFGAHLGDPIEGHTSDVSAITATEVGGRWLVISGSRDATIRVWELETRTQVGDPIETGGSVGELAVTEVAGQAVVVAGVGGSVQVWDLESRELLHDFERSASTANVASLAVGELDGRPIVAVGRSSQQLQLGDLETGSWIAGRDSPNEFDTLDDCCRGSRVAIGEMSGLPVLVSGGNPSAVSVWDLATLERISGPADGQDGLHQTVATAELDDQLLVISGSSDETIQLWDAETGDPVGDPWVGHTNWVTSLAVFDLDGRPVVASGGGTDGTVRVWELPTGTPVAEPIDTDAWVSSMAVAILDGDPVVVTGGDDSVIRVWSINK